MFSSVHHRIIVKVFLLSIIFIVLSAPSVQGEVLKRLIVMHGEFINDLEGYKLNYDYPNKPVYEVHIYGSGNVVFAAKAYTGSSIYDYSGGNGNVIMRWNERDGLNLARNDIDDETLSDLLGKPYSIDIQPYGIHVARDGVIAFEVEMDDDECYIVDDGEVVEFLTCDGYYMYLFNSNKTAIIKDVNSGILYVTPTTQTLVVREGDPLPAYLCREGVEECLSRESISGLLSTSGTFVYEDTNSIFKFDGSGSSELVYWFFKDSEYDSDAEEMYYSYHGNINMPIQSGHGDAYDLGVDFALLSVDDQDFAFKSSFRSTETDSWLEYSGIWVRDPDGQLRHAVDYSMSAQYSTTYGYPSFDAFLTNDKQVVHTMPLDFGSGIWFEGEPIVLAGQQAPGGRPGAFLGDDVVFKDVGNVAVNGKGQVAFSGRLEGTGIDEFNDKGIWATNSSGNIVLVQRIGDTISYHGKGYVVEMIYLDSSGSGYDGYNGVFDNCGNLVYSLKTNIAYDDGFFRQGVVVASVDANVHVTSSSDNFPHSGMVLGVVDAYTGELVLNEPADIDLGGPLPLYFSRYYASALTQEDTNPMGNNWMHNFQIKMFASQDVDGQYIAASVITERGRAIKFKKDGDTNKWIQLAPLDVKYELIQEGGKFILVNIHSNLLYTFNTLEAQGCWEVLRLSKIQDTKGNALTLSYNGDLLQSVSDGLGRALSFEYDGNDHLTAVSDGQRKASFKYTDNNLTEYTGASANTTKYTYYDESIYRKGLLTSIILPGDNEESPTMTVTYEEYWDYLRGGYRAGDTGMVDMLEDAKGNRYIFSYSGLRGTTTVENPNSLGGGNNYIQEYKHNSKGELVSHTDKLVRYGVEGEGRETAYTRTYEYDDKGRQSSVINRLGAETRYTYHGDSSKVASITTSTNGLDDTVIDSDNIFNTVFEYTKRSSNGIDFYDLTKVTYPDHTYESFVYDESGNLIMWTDREFYDTSYTYNERGQLASITNPKGGRRLFYYNNDGTLFNTQDEYTGIWTTFQYDNLKRLQIVEYADSTTRGYMYNDLDMLVTAKDENDGIVSYTYYGNTNLESITVDFTGDNPITYNYEYDDMNRLSKIKDPLGNFSLINYDNNWRVNQFTNRSNDSNYYSYDFLSRVIMFTDPRGGRWGTDYDAEGAVSSTTGPLGSTTEYENNSLGQLKKITSNAGHSVNIKYDKMGRIKEYEDTLGNKTTIDYDKRGLVSNINYPEDIKISYERDELGLVTKVTDPRGDEWLSEYDPMGKLISNTDPLGNKHSYKYNDRNRLYHIDYPDESTVDIGYNGNGSIISIDSKTKVEGPIVEPVEPLSYSDSKRQIVLERQACKTDVAEIKSEYLKDTKDRFLSDTTSYFDELGSLIKTENTITLEWHDTYDKIIKSNGLIIEYDESERIKKITYPGTTKDGKSREVTYVYNKGLPQSVTDWNNNTTVFDFDSSNRIKSIKRPNAINTNYEYYDPKSEGYDEALGKYNINMTEEVKDSINQIKVLRDTGAALNGVAAGNGYHSLIFNSAGDIIYRNAENMFSNYDLTEYDTRSTERNFGKGSLVNGGEYTYDPRLRIRNELADPENTNLVRKYEWYPDNLLSSMCYGETALQDAMGGPILYYDIDYREDYEYDAKGLMTSKSSRYFGSYDSEDYYWNYAFPIPRLSVQEMSGSSRLLHIYTPDGDRILYSIREIYNSQCNCYVADDNFFYHFDNTGNTTYVSNGAGNVVERYMYSLDNKNIITVGTNSMVSYKYGDTPFHRFFYNGRYGWMLIGYEVAMNDGLSPVYYIPGAGEYYHVGLGKPIGAKNNDPLWESIYRFRSYERTGIFLSKFNQFNGKVKVLVSTASIIGLIIIPDPFSKIGLYIAIVYESDSAQAGLRSALTGQEYKSFAYQALVNTTGSECAAGVIDTTVGIFLSPGAGAYCSGTKLGGKLLSLDSLKTMGPTLRDIGINAMGAYLTYGSEFSIDIARLKSRLSKQWVKNKLRKVYLIERRNALNDMLKKRKVEREEIIQGMIDEYHAGKYSDFGSHEDFVKYAVWSMTNRYDSAYIDPVNNELDDIANELEYLKDNRGTYMNQTANGLDFGVMW